MGHRWIDWSSNIWRPRLGFGALAPCWRPRASVFSEQHKRPSKTANAKNWACKFLRLSPLPRRYLLALVASHGPNNRAKSFIGSTCCCSRITTAHACLHASDLPLGHNARCPPCCGNGVVRLPTGASREHACPQRNHVIEDVFDVFLVSLHSKTLCR